jgi:hypothetical protein
MALIRSRHPVPVPVAAAASDLLFQPRAGPQRLIVFTHLPFQPRFLRLQISNCCVLLHVPLPSRCLGLQLLQQFS